MQVRPLVPWPRLLVGQAIFVFLLHLSQLHTMVSINSTTNNYQTKFGWVLTLLQIRLVVIFSKAHLNANGCRASLQQTSHFHQMVSNQLPADTIDTLQWSRRVQVKADGVTRRQMV